jgi:hypothetical protein
MYTSITKKQGNGRNGSNMIIDLKEKLNATLLYRLWGCCNVFLIEPIQDGGIMY